MKTSNYKKLGELMEYRRELETYLRQCDGPLVRRFTIFDTTSPSDKDAVVAELRKETILEDEATAFTEIQDAISRMFQGRLNRTLNEIEALGVTVDD
ncbi:hypothetical protein [Hyphomicrobium sp. DY-1]|uniref:hypothetical protein n=1 Tax=Hyphomicrobium sp. DY-1 TaxID=3075650 RepID=UPI0039C4952F